MPNKHTHKLFNDPHVVGLMVQAIATAVDDKGKPDAAKATQSFLKQVESHGLFNKAGVSSKPPSAELSAATQAQMAAIIDVITAIGKFSETSVAVNAELQAHGQQ